MIFDQYSRYKACADLLRQVGLEAGSTILDVGSGPECLFGQFVHENAITYVDPLIPSGSAPGLIHGNVFTTELDGMIFDHVIAVDVLEHVPPERRHAFLTRLSSLCGKTLILGFPSVDACDAAGTDKTIDDLYMSVTGHDYPWLEEHRNFGLPSLAGTLKRLGSQGWHCQTIGHGHAPWLRELLGFVVCALDRPDMLPIVEALSYRFNNELYPYDFRAPFYRHFIVATRTALGQPLSIPASGKIEVAEKTYSSIMSEAQQQYFISSLRRMAEQDARITEQDARITEQDAKITEQDAKRMANIIHAYLPDNNLQEISVWAVRIHQSPFKYGIKKYGYSLAKRIYRALPLEPRTKARLREKFQAYMSVLRNRSSGGAVAELPDDQIIWPSPAPSRRDLFIFAVIDWHFRTQRPQQLARSFAKAGSRVFYFSNVFINHPQPGYRLEQLDPALPLYQISLHVKGAPTIYFEPPTPEIEAMLQASMSRLLSNFEAVSTLSLVQHAFWFQLAKSLPNTWRIYDCMDYHKGFGNVPEKLIETEKDILRHADLVMVTSSWLKDFARGYNTNVALVRNAAEFDHFAGRPAAIYRDAAGRRIIGYYGAIAEWFDLELVRAVAQENRNCLVLLIGNDTEGVGKALRDLPNVVFTGEVPYSRLPYYLYAFDVCLLPFKVMPLTLATNPVKIYEYLSAGKPVVSVDLPEIEQFGELVYRCATHQQFLQQVVQAMQPENNSTELVSARKAFAAAQTWDHRITELNEALVRLPLPKISVIVLTYNNLGLTQACLESLLKQTDYPGLEIVIVDNASTDDTPQWLQSFGQKHPEVKIILNVNNLGFAAGNNVGLAAATGDYLVLLNNDTVVTRGWALTLMRHLRSDPSIGLIGPVTNNIGNEAHIGIAYSDMGEMQAKATAYIARHLGEVIPLRTVAFFCVMMSRQTYERVGPLDEAFGRGFFEDDDYCRRIEQLGLHAACAEDVFVHHHLSASFNNLKQKERQELFEENKKTYEAKWGTWIPHGYRSQEAVLQVPSKPEEPVPEIFAGQQHLAGRCIVCGKVTRFFYPDPALWRESLTCEHCRTTSRYRSIARGLLRAIEERCGVSADALAILPAGAAGRMRIYDTQPPFYYTPCAYPLPDLLKTVDWIEVDISQYKPEWPLGAALAKGITNQNLECLTFPDESFDVVITSDVMEHVRLDDRAHLEIYRILKPGGIYLFTVPHLRDMERTLVRVRVEDPEDPARDVHLLAPEYHGDTNNEGGGGVLSYRVYGRNLEDSLREIGFEVEYFKEDVTDAGILNSELYYCRKTG